MMEYITQEKYNQVINSKFCGKIDCLRNRAETLQLRGGMWHLKISLAKLYPTLLQQKNNPHTLKNKRNMIARSRLSDAR